MRSQVACDAQVRSEAIYPMKAGLRTGRPKKGSPVCIEERSWKVSAVLPAPDAPERRWVSPTGRIFGIMSGTSGRGRMEEGEEEGVEEDFGSDSKEGGAGGKEERTADIGQAPRREREEVGTIREGKAESVGRGLACLGLGVGLDSCLGLVVCRNRFSGKKPSEKIKEIKGKISLDSGSILIGLYGKRNPPDAAAKRGGGVVGEPGAAEEGTY